MSYISTLSKLNSYKAIVNEEDVYDRKSFMRDPDLYGANKQWIRIATSPNNVQRLKKYLSKVPYKINITILANLNVKRSLHVADILKEYNIIKINELHNVNIPVDNQSLNFILTTISDNEDFSNKNIIPPTPWMIVHRIFQDYGEHQCNLLFYFITDLYSIKSIPNKSWSDLFTFGSARKGKLTTPTEAMVDLAVYYTIHGTLKGAFKFPKTFHGGNLNPSRETVSEFTNNFKSSYNRYLRELKGKYLLV